MLSACPDQRVRMKLNLWEKESKNKFRFWAKHFQTLSKKFRQLCQRWLPRIQSNISKNMFSGKELVFEFSEIERTKLEFWRYYFRRVVVTAFYIFRVKFWWRDLFLKKKCFFKNCFGFCWKCYGFVSAKPSSRVVAVAVNVSRTIFWGKIYFLEKKVFLRKFMILS